ncbi:hypothetical protein CAL7716_102390 (plasmid) [Calothrix sp. PCC 7716]|nr:hypothetical protein CAL7716_102390 [Calothrix sp. PCC 7716]
MNLVDAKQTDHKIFRNKVVEIALEILQGTEDGNRLSARHLSLLQYAVNNTITDEGIKELERVHQLVIDNNYVDWFHGIPGMRKRHNGYIEYKSEIIEHYSFRNYHEEERAITELYARCQHIELLGIKPTIHNCVHFWGKYEKLQPNVIAGAYPLVIDDYFSGDKRWRQIDKAHYKLIFEAQLPLKVFENTYLTGGSPYIHLDDGQGLYIACKKNESKYYARLLTIKEFLTEINEPIVERPPVQVDWYHGIEHLYKYYDGCIKWKGELVEIESQKDSENKVSPKELHSRCLHIESLGLKPSVRNCIHYWEEDYKDLRPNTIGSASPWVHEDYYNNDPKWRQIDEYHYYFYRDEIYPTKLDGNLFLDGNDWLHTESWESVHLACKYEDSKYYAQLMTIKQYDLIFCTKTN